MYATCLFCQHDLGRNETFEGFPVGRRLAYDAARGRLWVVCRRCARWNLTPLEERWAAIDEAERRFRSARTRAGSGEIALARLPEGTELVRIGRPDELELTAWRHGDQLGRRRRKYLIATGAALVVGGAALLGGVAATGISAISAMQLGNAVYRGTREGAPWSTVALVRLPDGDVLRVRPKHLKRTRIGQTRSGELSVIMRRDEDDHLARASVFSGDDARRVLRQIIPAVNRMGGTRDEVEQALGRLHDARSAEAFFSELGRRGERFTRPGRKTSWWQGVEANDPGGLFALPRSLALAIEIAGNDERERRAMAGEIALLEAAWREAEEIARIADAL